MKLWDVEIRRYGVTKVAAKDAVAAINKCLTILRRRFRRANRTDPLTADYRDVLSVKFAGEVETK